MATVAKIDTNNNFKNKFFIYIFRLALIYKGEKLYTPAQLFRR